MKIFLLLLCTGVISTPLAAQMTRPTGSGPAYYFNSFQYFTHSDFDSTTAVDSAMYYLRMLAADSRFERSLQDLLHNSYAQSFILRDGKDMTQELQKDYESKRILASGILQQMLKDTNTRLSDAAGLINSWVMAQKNRGNSALFEKTISNFLQTHSLTGDIRKNYVGRYALLLYNMTPNTGNAQELSKTLFNRVMENLKSNQIPGITDSSSYQLKERRTWYRYLYAYGIHSLAKKLLQERKVKEAGEQFKLAYAYSPDLIDLNNSSAFFYDMIFLFGEENNIFRDDYLSYVMRHSNNKTEARDILLNMAINDPSLKSELKKYYDSNFSGEVPFTTYWQTAVSRNWKAIPDYSLKQMNGKMFSIADYKGKWLLIDFWGTWCAPCRKEHPEMDLFSKEIDSLYKNKISLMTIACRDKPDAVIAYMQEKKFSFPVVMSDGKIENTFPVAGYPTKILINPEGKYTVVPFGVRNWVEFVKQYCDL